MWAFHFTNFDMPKSPENSENPQEEKFQNSFYEFYWNFPQNFQKFSSEENCFFFSVEHPPKKHGKYTQVDGWKSQTLHVLGALWFWSTRIYEPINLKNYYLAWAVQVGWLFFCALLLFCVCLPWWWSHTSKPPITQKHIDQILFFYFTLMFVPLRFA